MPGGRSQWGWVGQPMLHRSRWPILHCVSIVWSQGPGGRSLAAAVQRDDREKRQCAQASVMRHARFGATLVQRTAAGAAMGRCQKAQALAVPGKVARNAKHHVILPTTGHGVLLGMNHQSALYGLQGQGCGTQFNHSRPKPSHRLNHWSP